MAPDSKAPDLPRPVKKPLLSVIIPTYNRKDLVARAVRSVLDQKSPFPFEILVTDDGSTDGTGENLRTLFKNETESELLRIFKYANSGDCAIGRNRGALEARGEYFAFLDSDDWWKPGRFEFIWPILGRTELILEAPAPKKGLSHFDPLSRPKDRDQNFDPLRLFLSANWGVTSSGIISKRLFRTVRGFSEGYYRGPSKRVLSGWEDYEMWLRCLLQLKREHRLERFAWYYADLERFVVYDPQPEGLGAVKIRSQMFREAMTLLRISRKLPRVYWPLFLRRMAGATKACLIG